MVPTHRPYYRSYNYNPYYRPYYSGFGMSDMLLWYMVLGNHGSPSTVVYQPYPIAPVPIQNTAPVVQTVPAYLCSTQYLAKVDQNDGNYKVSDDVAQKVQSSRNSVVLFNTVMLVLIVLAVIGVIGWIIYIKTRDQGEKHAVDK